MIFRQSYKVWEQSCAVGHNVVIGDDNLILKAQKEGVRKDRTKDKKIYTKEYKFEKGMILIYKNKSEKNDGLSETLDSTYFEEFTKE